jgi:hypothetical protein
LRERLTQEKLIESILGWCKRVEFRVVVQTGETKRTITAEKADDFVFERSDMTRENARLFVKSFPLNRPGLEGEIYIFGRTDENGESWASSFVKSDEDFHPIADERSVPKSIICLHGISMSDHIFEDGIFPEHIFGHRKASFRLDIRDKNFQPSLSRGWNYMLAEEHKDAVRDTLVQALREHLEVTKLNQKEDAWKYRNMLANEYEVMPLWESYGGMIPMYREGHFTTMSLAECRSHESLTSVHRMFKDRYDFVRPEDEDPTIAATDMQQSAVILGTDLLLLDGKILSALVDQRVPADIQYNENNVISIVWRSVGSAGSEGSGSRIFVDEKHRGYRFCIGTIVAGIKDDRHIAFFVSGRKYPMYWVRTLWNKDHPLTAWLTRVKNACDDGEHSLARPMSKVFSFINSYGSGHGGGMNLNNLNRYLRGWATLANLPDDLHPPEIEITEDMFVFLG